MPPRELSRHSFTRLARDDQGRLWLARRTPFRFRQFPDNEHYTVRQGDTLDALAGQRYRVIDPDRACGLFWVIADFQPDPIHDPTIRLETGRTLIIPSARVVATQIFNNARLQEA